MPTEEEFQAQINALTGERDGLKARVKEVNDEAKGHRLNADNFRTQAEKAAAEAKAAREEAEAKIAEATKRADETLTKAQQKALAADIKVAAREAGAVDVSEVLVLLDRTKLKINGEGDVENAGDVIAEMKKAKPHLFGAPSTSNPAPKPTPADPSAKSAKDMTPAEAAARLKQLGGNPKRHRL